jgi:hypothetical protein
VHVCAGVPPLGSGEAVPQELSIHDDGDGGQGVASQLLPDLLSPGTAGGSTHLRASL